MANAIGSKNWTVLLSLLLAGVAWPGVAAADQRFHAILAPAQEVPSQTANARGIGTVTLNSAETEITVTLSFQDLSGPANGAHIHDANAGVNGPIIFDLTSFLPPGETGAITTQTFAVSAGQVTELKNRGLYFNIHTAARPAGELRGQILAAPPERYSTRLTGAAQVPPVSSSGSGLGVVHLNAAENQIAVDLTWSGLSSSATAAHIHGPASASGNAGVLFDFGAVSGTSGMISTQTFAITEAQAAQLRAGQFYFNIHSVNNGGGEIRGQIALAPVQLFTATLNGNQQVPSVSSNGTGAGSVLLNRAEDTIYVNLNFSGLTSVPSSAHIHGPATVGVNAGVVFDFSGAIPAATSGTMLEQTFAITPAQVAQLKAGEFYFNIHTANFGGGEIRGQVLLAPWQRRTAILSGSGEVPPVVTVGGGLGTVLINPTEDQISATATFASLSSLANAAHVHGPAAAGEIAGVLFGFDAVPSAGTGSVADQAFAITAAQVADLKASLHYINVHTANHGSGEIRGQMSQTPGLTINRGGTGSAATNTTSTPSGINCGGDCAEAFPASTVVTLTPGTAAAGSVFAGWMGGGCNGTSACTFTTSTFPTTVTAVYTLSSSAISFTDDPVSAGTTVRAVHINELRATINSLRATHGLAAASFTDSSLAGTAIKAVHVTELRTALGAVYTQRGWVAPSYSDTTMTAGATIVKALHINELRMAVRLIE